MRIGISISSSYAVADPRLGARYMVERARISPLPREPIEVWIGAQVPAAIHRAARLAEGWLASTGLTPRAAAEAVNVYRQACAEHGRSPAAVALRRDVYVGASSQEARSVVGPYVARGYRGFSEEALMDGSASEVADQIARLGEAGYTDIIVRNISADQAQALATIERLAEVRAQLA